jgi:hypothetical protein
MAGVITGSLSRRMGISASHGGLCAKGRKLACAARAPKAELTQPYLLLFPLTRRSI